MGAFTSIVVQGDGFLVFMGETLVAMGHSHEFDSFMAGIGAGTPVHYADKQPIQEATLKVYGAYAASVRNTHGPDELGVGAKQPVFFYDTDPVSGLLTGAVYTHYKRNRWTEIIFDFTPGDTLYDLMTQQTFTRVGEGIWKRGNKL